MNFLLNADDSSFEENQMTFTIIKPGEAELVGEILITRDFEIPRSITHEGIQYIIKRMSAHCIFEDENTIRFAQNSKLDYIGRKERYLSQELCNIELPPSLRYLNGNFIKSKTNKVIIPREGKFFKLGDDGILYRCRREIVFAQRTRIHIMIREGITKINDGSFSLMRIRYIKIPSSVRMIGESAFYDCGSLRCVKFAPNSQLERIGKRAFRGIKISRICFPSSLKILEEHAFNSCDQLKSIRFEKESQIESIESYALHMSCIKRITIPASVKEIGYKALFNYTIERIEFEENSYLEKINNQGLSNSDILQIIVAPERIHGLLKPLIKPTVELSYR